MVSCALYLDFLLHLVRTIVQCFPNPGSAVFLYFRCCSLIAPAHGPFALWGFAGVRLSRAEVMGIVYCCIVRPLSHDCNRIRQYSLNGSIQNLVGVYLEVLSFG